MAYSNYVRIDEETAKRAFERAYKELEELTEGRAEQAIGLVEEITKLHYICKELKEGREKEESEQ